MNNSLLWLLNLFRDVPLKSFVPFHCSESLFVVSRRIFVWIVLSILVVPNRSSARSLFSGSIRSIVPPPNLRSSVVWNRVPRQFPSDFVDSGRDSVTSVTNSSPPPNRPPPYPTSPPPTANKRWKLESVERLIPMSIPMSVCLLHNAFLSLVIYFLKHVNEVAYVKCDDRMNI